MRIKINLKINISETSGTIELEFCVLSIFKIQQNSVPVSLKISKETTSDIFNY